MKTLLLVMGQTSLALAEGAPGGAGAPGLSPFIPTLIILGIIYFMILRPQQKKLKAQQKFLTELKRGDMVVTQSGIVGLVKALSDKIVTLEIDEGVCLKILRTQILEGANTLKDSKPA